MLPPCRVGGYNKGETNRFNLDVSLYSVIVCAGRGNLGYGKRWNVYT